MSCRPQPSSCLAPPDTRKHRVRSVRIMRELEAGSTLLPCTSRQDDTYMIRMCESRFYRDNKNYNGQEELALSQRASIGGKESEFIFFKQASHKDNVPTSSRCPLQYLQPPVPDSSLPG